MDASDAVFRDPLRSGGHGPHMIALGAVAGVVGASKGDAAASRVERPRRQVALARPLALGRFTVTFDDYQLYAAATGLDAPDDYGFGRGARPVINVSWLEAVGYCDWLSAQTGRRYRLPSEAEWELACRAGGAGPFHTGWSITSADANYMPSSADVDDPDKHCRCETVPVGALAPNAWGLHEMHGNVGEWCADRWLSSLKTLPRDGAPRPVNPARSGASAVVRGGGWSTRRSFVRASDRWHYAIDQGFEMVGFRVACDL